MLVDDVGVVVVDLTSSWGRDRAPGHILPRPLVVAA